MGLLSGLLSGLIFGAFAIIIGKINNKIHKDGTSEEQNNIDEVSNSSAGYHLDGTFAGTLKEHPVVAPLPDELPPQEAEPIAAIPQTKENASEGAKEEFIIRDALMLGYSPCPVCHPEKR